MSGKRRLLVLDAGNTNIVFGLFEGDRLRRQARLVTQRANTTLITRALVRIASHRGVDGVAIASVVPRLDRMLQRAVFRSLGIHPLLMTWKNAGISLDVHRKSEVGADRIANTAGAYARYGRACIIIDCGTATTFDYVTPQGAFAGGAIAPGFLIANEALYQAAAKLPRVELRRPPRVIGKRTVTNIQSGLVYGYAGLVDHLVMRMKREVGGRPVVIATGGLAKLLQGVCQTIDVDHPALTLEGLKVLWEKKTK